MVEKIAANGWDILNESKGPRVIKTHLPFTLLPPNLLNSGCKVKVIIFIKSRLTT